MNETPERICEALEWLTGHKWADNGMLRGKPSFACDDGDQSFEWDSEDGYCLHLGWFKRNIEDELAYAIAVTAPWEWTGRYARVPSLSVESVCFRVAPDETTENDRFTWMLSLVNGPTMQDSEFTEDAAKTAARAAYLCWMRGRLAMKGLPEAPTPCTDCEGTGWSYHEHLPVERHIGCESCGGCGNERGTGITP